MEVMPTKQDKEIYNYVKESIPRDEDRKYLLKLLEDYDANTDSPLRYDIEYEPNGSWSSTIEKIINNKLPVKDLSGLYSVQYTNTRAEAENILSQFEKNNISSIILRPSYGGYAVMPI
jgi:hypothetical protein